MLLQLSIDTSSPRDIQQALAMLQPLAPPPLRIVRSEDVPPVSLEQAIDEVHASDELVETGGKVIDLMAALKTSLASSGGVSAPPTPPEPTAPVAPPAAASEADAFAAMQAAVQRSVPLTDIVALLTERKAAKVNQLTPEDRATFVVDINKLGVKA